MIPAFTPFLAVELAPHIKWCAEMCTMVEAQLCKKNPLPKDPTHVQELMDLHARYKVVLNQALSNLTCQQKVGSRIMGEIIKWLSRKISGEELSSTLERENCVRRGLLSAWENSITRIESLQTEIIKLSKKDTFKPLNLSR